MKEKALARTAEIQYWLGRHWEISAGVKVAVWKAMVLSILRYGAEVWFLNKIPSRDLEGVQLRMLKSVLRVNKSTTDEFVRGELGAFELERARDKSMLVWLGRIMKLDNDRWVRRLFNTEWQANRKGMRTWNWKAFDLLSKYSLREELDRWKIEGMTTKWKTIVAEAVERKAIEDWRDGVRSGKKLTLYYKLKTEWGFEEYLNKASKGIVLMCRFRSGSAGVGAELARYGGGGSGVWEDDGTEKKRSGVCRACSSGIVESIEHVLVECQEYSDIRLECVSAIADVLGVGSACVGPNLLDLLLGGKLLSLSDDGRLRVLAASTRFFVALWSARTIKIHGQRRESLGVNDAKRYGTK